MLGPAVSKDKITLSEQTSWGGGGSLCKLLIHPPPTLSTSHTQVPCNPYQHPAQLLSLSRHFILMGERLLLLCALINADFSVEVRLCPLSWLQFLYSALLNPTVTVYIWNFIISRVLGNKAALPSKVLQSCQRSCHLSKCGKSKYIIRGLDFWTLQYVSLLYDNESNFIMGKEVRKEYSFSFSHFKLNKDINTHHNLPPSPL